MVMLAPPSRAGDAILFDQAVRLRGRSSLYRMGRALADPARPPGGAPRHQPGAPRADHGAPPAALRSAERVHVVSARLGVPVVGEDGRPVAVSVAAAVNGTMSCLMAAAACPAVGQ
ncbi:hypothetical protein ACH3VS_35675 [Streptomyces sp. WSLK1-3]|uniref:hypothetical protein n=1 Tax=Streptomyces sp. WSLK1-3 TaxID=3375475 RepID=UPI0037A3D729